MRSEKKWWVLVDLAKTSLHIHLGHSALQKLVKKASFLDASNQQLKFLFDAVYMTDCEMNIGKITCSWMPWKVTFDLYDARKFKTHNTTSKYFLFTPPACLHNMFRNETCVSSLLHMDCIHYFKPSVVCWTIHASI